MIGLFDSGTGGLTILEACRRRLPEQSFLYLGDHAAAPYGHLENQEILALTIAGVEALFQAGCGLVVLACNTAAAVALRRIQQGWLPQHYPERRVLGVLVPMVETVTGSPWSASQEPAGAPRRPETLVLFATTKTVAAGSYLEEIEKRAPELRVVQQACPGLVAAIEEAQAPDAIAKLVDGFVRAALEKVGDRPPASAILGCTHFPLVEEDFAHALPAGTRVHAQPRAVAEALAAYLRKHSRFAGKGSQGSITYMTTSRPETLFGLRRCFPILAPKFVALADTAKGCFD